MSHQPTANEVRDGRRKIGDVVTRPDAGAHILCVIEKRTGAEVVFELTGATPGERSDEAHNILDGLDFAWTEAYEATRGVSS